MIYDLHNGSQSANVWAVGEKHDAANLDQPPLRGLDLDFCHSGNISSVIICQHLLYDVLDQEQFAGHSQSKVMAEDLLRKTVGVAVLLMMFKFVGGLG